MQTLFTISILCFLGILWAALALARRIKAGQIRSLSFSPPQRDFKHHLLSIAPEASTHLGPIPIRSRPIAPSPSPSTERAVPIFRSNAEPEAAVLRTRMNGLNQSVRDIAAAKQWILPPHPVRTMRLPVQRIGQPRKTTELARPSPTTRKPPQPASHMGVVHRLDPAYFNRDLGDLTDPYQLPPQLRANERSRRD
jgi:hypothetical protein